jgi:hypothetical protein
MPHRVPLSGLTVCHPIPDIEHLPAKFGVTGSNGEELDILNRIGYF